jgi:hypothetical protein
MSPSPQTLQPGVLYPPNSFGPPSYGWSSTIDYAGGSSPIYILWYPVVQGNALTGYIQKLVYDGGGKITNTTWAVNGLGQCPAPTAVWANRATLTYV